MFLTLGMHSDVLAMRGLSTFEDRGDHVILRTPSEPDYWDGNQVIFRDWSGDKDADVSTFQAAFPDASHTSFQWDRDDVTPEDVRNLFGDAYDVHVEEVMAQTKPMPDKQQPEGIIFRQIESDDDWEKLTALQTETGIEDGFERESYLAHLIERNISRRQQIADGHGAWWGAFDGDVLAADMGIFLDYRVARYQAVETAKSHRRRGICAALLRHVRLWAAEQEPRAQAVIVAETSGSAGRLYQKMGFEVVERLPVVKNPGI